MSGKTAAPQANRRLAAQTNKNRTVRGKGNSPLRVLLALVIAMGISLCICMISAGVFYNYFSADSQLQLKNAKLTGLSKEDSSTYRTTSDSPYLTFKKLSVGSPYLCLHVYSKSAGDRTVTVTLATDGEDITKGSVSTFTAGSGDNEFVIRTGGRVTSLRIQLGESSGSTFQIKELSAQSSFAADGFLNVFLARFVLLALLFFFIGLHFAVPVRSLYNFLFRWRFLIGAGLVALGVLLNINGSSIYEWSTIVPDHSSNIVFGQARSQRSDEWAVMTPMILSQQYSAAPYSWFSSIIRGASTDVFMVYALPVKTPLIIFRPFLIGYLFLGSERGLSFFWCARAVCLWLVSFEFFRLITNDKCRLSAAGAMLLLFSPVVQWWFAINGLVEMLIFGFLFIIVADKFLSTRHVLVKLLCLATAVLCGGGYIMTLYPAWMVPLAYCFLALLIWVIIKNHRKHLLRGGDIAGLIAAIAALAGCMVFLFMRSGSTISAVMNTVYPGDRLETGGGSMGRFLNYVVGLKLPYLSAAYLKKANINVVETSTLVTFFPMCLVLTALVLFRQIRCRLKKDSLLLVLLAFGAFLSVYVCIGFPKLLAKISLLYLCQSYRAFLGVDLINLVMLFRALSDVVDIQGSTDPAVKKFRIPHLTAVWIGSSVILCAAAWYCVNVVCKRICTDQEMWGLAIVAILAAFLMLFIFRFRTAFAVYMSAIALAGGLFINPVQLGTGGLKHTDLANEISSVVTDDQDALWAVDTLDFPWGNYPIMMGAATINSTNTYPNLARWESIDTGGDESDVYNRYAQIKITLTGAEDVDTDNQFKLLNDDYFSVSLSNKDVKKLKIRYVLTSRDLGSLSDDTVTYRLVSTTPLDGKTNIYIYKVVTK